MTRAGSILMALGMVVLVAGCPGNSTTEFPPGLTPLEDNTAPAPEGFAEQLNIVKGDTLDWDFVHGRAYVHAPVAMVWAALHDPHVIADTRATDKQEFEIGVEPEYEYEFVIHYEVNRFITINWDETYRLGALGRANDAPAVAMARYQKTWGSDYIDVLEGTAMVIEIEPEITEVQYVKHLDAFGAGADNIGKATEDEYARLLAWVHDEPLPHF